MLNVVPSGIIQSTTVQTSAFYVQPKVYHQVTLPSSGDLKKGQRWLGWMDGSADDKISPLCHISKKVLPLSV